MMEKRNHNHPDDTTELLSAYIDNAVDISERRRAEVLLKRCDACAQEFQELRQIKQWLQSLPEIQPRRSFKLHPATKSPRRLIFPTLRWATLAAAALLFVVLGIDTLERISSQGEVAFSIQQQAESAAAPEADEPAAGAPAEAVPESKPTPAAAALSTREPSPIAEAAASPAAEVAPAAESSPAPLTEPTEKPMAAADESTEEATARNAPPEDDAIAGGTEPSFGTVQPEAEPDAALSDAPVDTLRIAVVILLLVTLALGSGAVWTQRRYI